MKVKVLSCVRLVAIPWTAVYKAPPSMGFSRQEYWSGVPLPSLEAPNSKKGGEQSSFVVRRDEEGYYLTGNTSATHTNQVCGLRGRLHGI